MRSILPQNCFSESCKVYCNHTTQLYEQIYLAISLSNCSSIEELIIDNQNFENSIDFEEIKPIQQHVGKIILISPNLPLNPNTRIFDKSIFTTTFSLALHKAVLPFLTPSLLQELPALHHLIITCKVKVLSEFFFTPVEKQLVNLVFNADLKIPGNASFFGFSRLNNLMHLDLSENVIVGTLTKNVFGILPHLKYLSLQACHISSIKVDAFAYIYEHLILLDLSRNSLSTLDGEMLQPLLMTRNNVLIDLNFNIWNCNCEFVPFLITFFAFTDHFVDGNYCSKPTEQLGLPWHDLYNLEEYCIRKSVTLFNKSIDLPIDESTTTVVSFTDTDSVDLESDETVAQTLKTITTTNKPNTIQFPPPDYNFEITLLHNNAVKIEIIDCPSIIDINVIWFPENKYENYNSLSDTSCDIYAYPSITTKPLLADTTYTFCIVPSNKQAISPHNCLPFYVPAAPVSEDKQVWIANEYKNFTIFTMCMVWLFSLVVGCAIAYWTIKTYPNLLESSKINLSVKKNERLTKVSTINVCPADRPKSPVENIVLHRKCSSTTTTNNNYRLNAQNLERSTSCVPEYEIPNLPPPPLPQRNSKY